MCAACWCSRGCRPRWFPRAEDPNNPATSNGRCFARFISRCGSNDPVHLSVSCKVGASAFKQCPRAPISSGGCDRPAGACVALAARHQLPGDPRHLVGERDRRELGRVTLQQRHEPAGRVVRGAPARLPDHRGRALPAVECSRGDAGPASSSPGARRSAGRRRGSPSSAAGRRRSGPALGGGRRREGDTAGTFHCRAVLARGRADGLPLRRDCGARRRSISSDV